MNYNNNSQPSIEATILNSIRGSLVDTHTTLIAKITKINQKTIDCKPVISRLVNDKAVDLPVFIEVPVINFLGGSSSIQMPLAVGDYVILLVMERCFDNFYAGNDFQPPLEARIHDYSDSIAICGIKNMLGELDIPTVITMLGDGYIQGNYNIDGNVTRIGNENITGTVTIDGTLNVTGDIVLNGVSLDNFVNNHTHSGVQSGGSNTGIPN